ncbi:MAG: lipase, partial [Verrucomicrobiales bacterium]|nr:lipase [Verrucomicrobiales bacterium]
MNRLIIAAMMLTLHGMNTNAFPMNSSSANDYVILLHGLGRTPLSMKRLEWTLRRENYRVINLAYPSTRVSIQDAADHWLDNILKTRITDPTVKIHFVAHSLGG